MSSNNSIVTVALDIISIASFLSVGVLVTVYSQAKIVTQSKGSRKQKAYYQFWAFQVFATSFVLYTVIQNSHIEQYILAITLLSIALGILCGMYITKFDIETPTHFCKCCQSYCHCIVLWMSLCSSLLITTFALFSIPTIILVYYLYPARTLLRLPLLTNAVIYINSLLALLLFQCERLFYPCMKNVKLRDAMGCCKSFEDYKICRNFIWNEDQQLLLAERTLTHHEFYSSFYNKSELKKYNLKNFIYICSPFGTVIILAILILFVIIIHELTDLHLSSVKDLNLNLLLTLAPTLLLLFVSWYKFDIFYDLKDEEEESKKELLLKEILEQEKLILKKIHPATEPGAANEDRQPDAILDVATGNGPNRQGVDKEMSELAQLDTAHTSRDIDTPQATGDTAQATGDTAQATGDTAQATRPEVTRAATRDTGDVVATPIATETTATEDEATGSSETTRLIDNNMPDYKSLTT